VPTLIPNRGGRASAIPETTPDTHLAYLVARVHHRLQQAMDRALRTVDITPTQFYALAHIAQSPGLSGADLARGLMTTPQAVATLLRRLSTAGLVANDQPGRGVAGAVRLTAAGQAKLGRAGAVAVAAEAVALSSLSAADQKVVAGVLRSLLTELDEPRT
jgi:DNA-binding MarR family transcriptional regulator